ncbi:MAG: TIR domain-containing protein [Candidatus Kapabacteria bacterium]|nr:TIR domain-containing protein [Candidatus Kapabacteria bacterium]
MKNPISEIEACILLLDNFRKKAMLLEEEFAHSRSNNFSTDPKNLPHAITFSEIKRMDILCTETLKKYFDHNSDFIKKWYINKNDGLSSPDDLICELGEKMTVLEFCKNLLQNETSINDKSISATDDIIYPINLKGQNMNTIKLFISHSHEDKEIMEQFILLLKKTLIALEDNEIKCSSVSGYGFDAGDDFYKLIKETAQDCVYILGMFSNQSLKSAIVMFECGIGWLNDKTIPIIIDKNISYDALPKPFQGNITKKVFIEEELIHLIESIARKLSLVCNGPSLFQGGIKAFMKFINSNNDFKSTEIIDHKIENIKNDDKNSLLINSKITTTSIIPIINVKDSKTEKKLKDKIHTLPYHTACVAYISCTIYPRTFNKDQLLKYLIDNYQEVKDMKPFGRGGSWSSLLRGKTTPIKWNHQKQYIWNNEYNPEHSKEIILKYIVETKGKTLPDDKDIDLLANNNYK